MTEDEIPSLLRLLKLRSAVYEWKVRWNKGRID